MQFPRTLSALRVPIRAPSGAGRPRGFRGGAAARQLDQVACGSRPPPPPPLPASLLPLPAHAPDKSDKLDPATSDKLDGNADKPKRTKRAVVASADSGAEPAILDSLAAKADKVKSKTTKSKTTKSETVKEPKAAKAAKPPKSPSKSKSKSKHSKPAQLAPNPNLPPPSPEQQLVIDALRTGRNAIVNAVAGSGKTTTILHLAAALPNKRVLALLYNRRLKFETKVRASAARVKNLAVDNYHGFAYKNYSSECLNDHGLARVISNDLPLLDPTKGVLDFDVLCLDEVQDMTPLLFRFVRKMISDLPRPPGKPPIQFVVLGDTKQEIYTFNKADARFLTWADDCFPAAREWVRVDHRTSYRLTPAITEFLNAAVLPANERIRVPDRDGEPGPKPRYLVAPSSYTTPPPISIPSEAHLNPTTPHESPSGGPWTPLDEIARYLSLGVPPSDILILAPSTRSPRSPARLLANAIAQSLPIKLQIADPSSDSQHALDESRGKLLICSYHQSKGLERPCVIVLSFDGSYRSDEEGVGNAQYVALTRSTRYLTLVQGKEFGPAKGVDVEGVKRFAEIVGSTVDELDAWKSPVVGSVVEGSGVEDKGTEVVPVESSTEAVPVEPSVSIVPARKKWPTGKTPTLPLPSLLTSLPTPLISSLFTHIHLQPLSPPSLAVPIARTKQTSDGLLEPVYDLVGKAAFLKWEAGRGGIGVRRIQDDLRFEKERREKEARGQLVPRAWGRLVDRRMHDIRQTFPDRLIDEILEMRAEEMGLDEFGVLAQVSVALSTGYLPRLLQLERNLYDFLTPEVVEATGRTLDGLFGDKAQYFVPLKRTLVFDEGKAVIMGTADAIDRNTVVSIKWSDSLRPEHVLELACLAALDLRRDGKERKTRGYIVANLATGQACKLSGEFTAVLRDLVLHRLAGEGGRMPDPVFRANLVALFPEIRGTSVPAWLANGLHETTEEEARRVFEEGGVWERVRELMLMKGVVGI